MIKLLCSSAFIGLLAITANVQSAAARGIQIDSGNRIVEASSSQFKHLNGEQLLAQNIVVISTDDLVEKLDLTDEQQQELQSTLMTYESKLEEAAETFQASVNALSEVLKPSSNEAEIRAARQDMVYAGQELRDLLFNRLMDVREILSEEQRQKVHKLIDELAANLTQ